MTLMGDLLLLAVDPEQRRLRVADKIGYALRGAELVELAIAERVVVTSGRIQVVNSAWTGDPRLDADLASLVGARKPPRAKNWVQHAGPQARQEQLAVLVEQGAIRLDRHPVLLIFSKTEYTVVDPGRWRAVKARVDAIASGTTPPSARERALVGLIGACGLSGKLYPGGANARLRKRLKEVSRRDQATAQVLNATDAAIRSATNAAVDAAVDAAVEAAIHAAVDATHHAATASHSGHDGGGGGGHH